MSEIYTTHAALYDAAFDWDVRDQVDAVAGLSGLEGGIVLEPMCGSGRLLRGFAKNGFSTVGVDQSPQMLALAQSRDGAEGLSGNWILSDVTDFDLDEACHLAVCPVNSLAHLATQAAMLAHLNAVSRNLYSGASYWVQLDLKQPGHVGNAEDWEFEYLGETLISEWGCSGYHDGFETHVSRFVFPDGRFIEDSYEMKVWSYSAWTDLLARSPFSLSAVYGGNSFAPLSNNPTLDGQHVFWQQLVKLH